MLDRITITLRQGSKLLPVYIDVLDNSLAPRWLTALNFLLENNYHLEKNFCWLGWTESARNAEYLIDAINASIQAINFGDLGYHISDHFTIANSITDQLAVNHRHFNQLHRYFEDLQGWSGSISNYYTQATPTIKWHIRQLNLLCHEFESLVLSMKKMVQAPEWRRPSQLMCWLNAPRFLLTEQDHKLFGIETINRKTGGVYLGVNKAVGKHHWEVFCDEGRDSRVSELTTSALRSQTQAAGDFDIEWGRDPGSYPWQIQRLDDFRTWLLNNGFDPEDASLTIGHPQVAQVDLNSSFGTTDLESIWKILSQHLDVYKVETSDAKAIYDYTWADKNYAQQQIALLV